MTGGCTDSRAVNFDAAATTDDGSCQGWSACVKEDRGVDECVNCLADSRWGPCSEKNVGFRHPTLDVLPATQIPREAITLDGSLDDWDGLVPVSRRWDSPAFATETGEVFGQGREWVGASF